MILHILDQSIQSDMSEVHRGVLLEQFIRLVHEKRPASGVLEDLLNVILSLTDMGPDQTGAVCLDEGVAREDPGLEEHLPDDPGDGALSGARVAADDEVDASFRGLDAEALSSQRVDFESLEYIVQSMLDVMHAYDVAEQFADLGRIGLVERILHDLQNAFLRSLEGRSHRCLFRRLRFCKVFGDWLWSTYGLRSSVSIYRDRLNIIAHGDHAYQQIVIVLRSHYSSVLEANFVYSVPGETVPFTFIAGPPRVGHNASAFRAPAALIGYVSLELNSVGAPDDAAASVESVVDPVCDYPVPVGKLNGLHPVHAVIKIVACYGGNTVGKDESAVYPSVRFPGAGKDVAVLIMHHAFALTDSINEPAFIESLFVITKDGGALYSSVLPHTFQRSSVIPVSYAETVRSACGTETSFI